MMREKERIMVTIAGSDSSAGAGIQADLKSAFAAGVYCATVITALTAQNTRGVRGVEKSSPSMVAEQLNAVLDDMNVYAVKCGMLPSAEIIDVVAEAAKTSRLPNLVVDPVMVATSGDPLIDLKARKALIEKLLPHALLVTPNIPEAEAVSGVKIGSESDFDKAAEAFKATGCRALLIKGGHLTAGTIVERLYDFSNGSSVDFTYPMTETANTHGTGCSLSASITAHLTLGLSLHDAVKEAENFVHDAIEAGKDKYWGEGHGPIYHFITLSDKR